MGHRPLSPRNINKTEACLSDRRAAEGTGIDITRSSPHIGRRVMMAIKDELAGIKSESIIEIGDSGLWHDWQEPLIPVQRIVQKSQRNLLEDLSQYIGLLGDSHPKGRVKLGVGPALMEPLAITHPTRLWCRQPFNKPGVMIPHQ